MFGFHNGTCHDVRLFPNYHRRILHLKIECATKREEKTFEFDECKPVAYAGSVKEGIGG